MVKSCENLHFDPLAHNPDLKKAQRTDLGSAPVENMY